jgi:O-antigen/teichoic acid export membrane protein
VPFSVAQRLLLVPNAVVTSALPTLTASAASADEAEFRRTLGRLLVWVGTALAPAVVLGVVWAPDILREWIGLDSGPAATVLRLSLIAVLLNSLTSVAGVACDSLGSPGTTARAAVAGGVANVALLLVLTPTLGLTGAALALPLSLVVLAIVLVLRWRRAPNVPSWGPRLGATDRRRVITATTLLLPWVAVVVVVQGRIESLTALVAYGGILLATAYGVVIGLFLGPQVARRLGLASGASG